MSDTAGFVKYPELVQFAREYPKHKKHLLLINDKDGKTTRIFTSLGQFIYNKYGGKNLPEDPGTIESKFGYSEMTKKLIDAKSKKDVEQMILISYRQGLRGLIDFEDSTNEEIISSFTDYLSMNDYMGTNGYMLLKNLSGLHYDLLESFVIKLLHNEKTFIVASIKPGESLASLPPSFLDLFKVFDLETGRFLDKAVEKEIKSTTKNKNTKGAKGKDNFDDVKLKMVVDWKGNYSNSEYKFFVKYKKSMERELDLDDRFKPVLYRLVKGARLAKTPNDYVSNADLKKAFYPRNDIDDAKRNIINAFVKIIGSRAMKIIKIDQGKGKTLLIPKKNITLKESGNPPF